MEECLNEEEKVHGLTPTVFNFKTKPKFKMDNLDLKFDTRHPEQNVEEIAQTTNNIQSTRMLPMNCQLPLDSHTVKRLSTLQTKLYNNERKLGIERDKLSEVRKVIKKEWEDLEERENELRKNFISFNKFVEENNEKRMRAQKQIEDDKAMFKEREEETNKLIEKTKEIQNLISLMEKNIINLKPYTVFLNNVVEQYDEFNNINEVMDRYVVLTESRDFLTAKYNQDMTNLENFKSDLMKLIEEKTFVIVGLNNQIANLQIRYENTNRKSLESESLVTKIMNNAVKQLDVTNAVKQSIWNVYVHMVEMKKHPIKIKKDNVEELLKYIKSTLTVLNNLNSVLKKKLTKVK